MVLEEAHTVELVRHIVAYVELVKENNVVLLHTEFVVDEIVGCILVEETWASVLVHFDMLTYNHDTWPCQWAGTEEEHSHH